MGPDGVENLLDRKFDVCFGHVDQNDDGFMDPADSLALIARVVVALGERFDSPKSIALFSAFDSFWQTAFKTFDSSGDGRVSAEEWRVGLRQAFAEDPKGFEEGFRPWAQALWEVCDRDGDGRVTSAEFACFHKAFGMSPGQSEVAFAHLDRDGNGSLSVDELLLAWQEFYTSGDPSSPGNWLYGDIWQDDIWDGTKVKL